MDGCWRIYFFSSDASLPICTFDIISALGAFIAFPFVFVFVSWNCLFFIVSYISFFGTPTPKTNNTTLHCITGKTVQCINWDQNKVATSGGSRQILLGGPRRGQCLTRGAQIKWQKMMFKDYKLSFTLKSSNI